MPLNQTEIFADFEGDRWFGRNQKALETFDPEADLPLRVMESYDVRPRSVLEIGAANGFRLAAIHRRYGARAVGVELSKLALCDGKTKFPDVDFVCGSAHAVPLHEIFDVVIVNFVLHWVDRSLLMRSVAEIDRLISDGGFLIIGDFYPSNFIKVPYHHLADEPVHTYKQNYAGLFLASGLYHSVCLLTASHSSKSQNADAGERDRTGVWLLKKNLTAHYMADGADGR
jgi:SAM-dependent methyltransferase